MIIEWTLRQFEYYVFYVLVTINMKHALMFASLTWPERLLRGKKALEVWMESINRMIYTTAYLLENFYSVFLLEKCYNIPFRSLNYPCGSQFLSTGLHAELLERTLNGDSLEIERCLGHCDSLNFKSKCELCSEKCHSEKLSQKVDGKDLGTAWTNAF